MAALLAGVLLYGAFTETIDLNRAACVIALVCLILSVVAALLLERRVVNRVAKVMDHAMVGSLVIFVAATWALGGGALNGRVQDQSHYLRRESRETLVTATTYYALAGFEVFFLALVPAGLMFKTRAMALKDPA
jgi:hypothetical protein